MIDNDYVSGRHVVYSDFSPTQPHLLILAYDLPKTEHTQVPTLLQFDGLKLQFLQRQIAVLGLV